MKNKISSKVTPKKHVSYGDKVTPKKDVPYGDKVTPKKDVPYEDYVPYEDKATPKKDVPYEDYVAVKQKEQNELKMLETIMDQALNQTLKQSAQSYISGIPLAGDCEYDEMPPRLQTISGDGKTIKKKILNGTYNDKRTVYFGGDDVPAKTRVNRYEQVYMEPTIRTEMEHVEPLPEMEASEATLPNDIEMFDNVRNGLKIIRTVNSTLIYAVVIDKTNELNRAVAIRCYGGLAFGGYVRDCSGDAYLIEGVEAAHLGSVPFSYRLEVPKAGCWTVGIPIPEMVLEAAFTPAQRKTLSSLRERFSEDRFDIQYLQMLQS